MVYCSWSEVLEAAYRGFEFVGDSDVVIEEQIRIYGDDFALSLDWEELPDLPGFQRAVPGAEEPDHPSFQAAVEKAIFDHLSSRLGLNRDSAPGP